MHRSRFQRVLLVLQVDPGGFGGRGIIDKTDLEGEGGGAIPFYKCSLEGSVWLQFGRREGMIIECGLEHITLSCPHMSREAWTLTSYLLGNYTASFIFYFLESGPQNYTERNTPESLAV